MALSDEARRSAVYANSYVAEVTKKKLIKEHFIFYYKSGHGQCAQG